MTVWKKQVCLQNRSLLPLQKGEDAVSWDRYLNWLGFTLNQNLCILELGVGFLRPEVIRFPFEKTCYFNQKSRYIRVHDRFWQLSAEIADRGVSVGQPPAVFFYRRQRGGGAMIAVIDYDAGNIRSVEKALLHIGQEVCVTRSREEILKADKVILPGVGAFGDAMEHLEAYGLTDVIREAVKRKTPFLGICLGLQLLFESSEEAPGVSGLGILKGKILRIPEGEGRKIPHMGWNCLELSGDGRLFRGLGKNPYVYFVHSYYLKAQDESIVKARTEYGVQIHASVEQENVFACQFHPEKSSDVGLHILNNFAGL